MTTLFSLNIAQIVADEIAAAGGVRDGVLTRSIPGIRTGGSLTGGTNPTSTVHTFKGFTEARERRRSGQISTSAMAVVTILGATIFPAATPEVNDSVVIDGTTYELLELLELDPSEAVFEFRSETR